MYQIKDIKLTLAKISNVVIEHKDYLCDLDGKSGDGDLGFSMESAFTAIETESREYTGKSIGDLFMRSAMACNKAAPSTMGTLISSGLMALAKANKNKEELSDSDIVAFPRIFADAISARGKANVGDKTILDALYPMADMLEKSYSEGFSLEDAFTKAADTAEESAKNTKGMLANSGRAKWIGKRAMDYADGGAILCGIIAKAAISKLRT